MSLPTKTPDGRPRWYGKIPNHWKVGRTKVLFSNRRERKREGDEQLSATQKFGVIPQRMFMEKEDTRVMLALSGTENFKHVDRDDFVISLRSFEGGIERCFYDGCVSPAYTVMTPNVDLKSSYFQYVFKSREFIREMQLGVYGIRDGKAVNFEDVARIVMPQPPTHEQSAIASYLDVETARIDALIDEKSKLIKLLREQSVMVAEGVVAPSSDGRQAKLGYFVNLLPGFAFPSESFSSDETDVPLLRGVNVAPGTIRWEDNVYWPADQCTGLERFRLVVGDVVFGMDRPWISSGARVALIGAESEGSLLLQRVCRIRGDKEISNRFIYYVLGSDMFRQSIEFELSGVSVPHISPEQITRFKIPVLTFDEQERRCQEADEEIGRIENLVDVAERMIVVLNELRSTTITDAVLGRIDVRAIVKNKEELEAA